MACISLETVFVSHCSGDPFGSCHQMVRNVLLSPDGALCESTDSGALVHWCTGAGSGDHGKRGGPWATDDSNALPPPPPPSAFHLTLREVVNHSGVVGVISVPVAVVSSSYNICLTCKPGPTMYSVHHVNCKLGPTWAVDW